MWQVGAGAEIYKVYLAWLLKTFLIYDVMTSFIKYGLRLLFYFICSYQLLFGQNNQQNVSPDKISNQGSLNSSEGRDFVNRWGHLVKNYKEPNKRSSGNKKHAQFIPERMVGQDYYFGALAYAEDFKFSSIGGISISADDDDSGLQGILSLNYSNYFESTYLMGGAGVNSFTLEQTVVGGGGVLRYFDRSYLLEPHFTVMNFIQAGLGYSFIKNEVFRGISLTNSNQNGFYGNDFIQNWEELKNSRESIYKKNHHIFHFNVGIGTEIGFKKISFVPFLINTTSFGDIRSDQLSWGLSMNLFYNSGFLSLGVSESEDSPVVYNIGYGNYF